MQTNAHSTAPSSRPGALAAGSYPQPGERYERPTFEVISLDCEISSYAPDGGDRPLF